MKTFEIRLGGSQDRHWTMDELAELAGVLETIRYFLAGWAAGEPPIRMQWTVTNLPQGWRAETTIADGWDGALKLYKGDRTFREATVFWKYD